MQHTSRGFSSGGRGFFVSAKSSPRGSRPPKRYPALSVMRRRYPDRPIMAVGAIVVKDDRVLLARRGKEPSYGLWSVPGGAVRLGEGLKTAALREVREECGIEIDVADVVEIVERMVRDANGRIQYHYIIVDYLARWLSGDLAPSSEVLEARWVPPDEFPRYQMTAGTAEVINRMLEAGKRAGII